MKIRKYKEFINEELNDTPESYIAVALKVLKKKIDKMFEGSVPNEDVEDNESNKKSIQQAKSDSKDKSKMSFKDLGLGLESSEISLTSKMSDSLTVKFSDAEFVYDLLIKIDIKEAIPKDPAADFNYTDIEKIFIKFKKYNKSSFEVIGQLTKNVNMKDIDEDFLVNLKIELDEMFGDDDQEEFKIETE